MALNFGGRSLFSQRDVRETPAATSSSSSSSTIIAPIGTILPWLKSYTNTPQALPTGWVECDGAVLSDGDSVYDGQTLPDLNGGEFLRGAATSGGTGGSSTHTHTVSGGTGGPSQSSSVDAAGATARATDSHTHAVATTDATSTLPTYYNVVWIIRIK